MSADDPKGALTPEQANAALGEIRGEIDGIDRELQRLLNARANCSLKVADVKLRTRGPDGAEDPAGTVFYRPEREADILRAVMARNDGPLPDAHMARLFREVISSSLSLEQPLTVAFLGPEGTFTEAAAIRHFGHFARMSPLTTIDEIFREVESRNAHYGVVPVENSTEGMVNHTLDCFLRSDLRICGEVELAIHHHLLARDGVEPEALTRIYSHQQSFAQCRNWLDQHWPGVERVPVSSNAEAARLASVAEPGEGIGAVAGSMAADRWGLAVLSPNIEDNPDNSTRFLVVGHQKVAPSSRDKTSILVAMRNRPGSLYQVLEPFHRHGISLSRIETRPSRTGNWSYVFFIDFEGHEDADASQAALAEVAEIAVEIRSLGSYPVGVL